MVGCSSDSAAVVGDELGGCGADIGGAGGDVAVVEAAVATGVDADKNGAVFNR